MISFVSVWHQLPLPLGTHYDHGTDIRLPLMKYPDGTEEEEDELFDSEEEAKEYGDYMISCSREGAETLCMSNPGDYPLEDYEDPDYEVIETE